MLAAKEHKKSFLTRFNKVSPDSGQTLLAQAQVYMKGNGFSSHRPYSVTRTVQVYTAAWLLLC